MEEGTLYDVMIIGAGPAGLTSGIYAPSMFAAGDVRIVAGRYAQAVVAAGDGAIAAIEAEKYLSSSIGIKHHRDKGGNNVSNDQ